VAPSSVTNYLKRVYYLQQANFLNLIPLHMRNLRIALCLLIAYILSGSSRADAQWIADSSAVRASQMVVKSNGEIWTVYKWYSSTNPKEETGVQQYKDGIRKRFTKADGLADDSVRGITLDPSGNIWVAGKRGISKFDGNSWTSFTITDTATDRREFTAIACDSNGLIWTTSCITTIIRKIFDNLYEWDKQAAIHSFNGEIWTTYWPNDEFKLPAADLLHIEADVSGKVYALGPQASVPPSYGLGFYIYDSGKWTSHDISGHSQSSKSKQPTGMSVAPDHSVWITFAFPDDSKLISGNVHRYSNGMWTGYDTSNGLRGGTSPTLACDANGRIWLGSNAWDKPGVIILENGKAKLLTQDVNPLFRHGAEAFAFRGNDVYVANAGGISILPNGLASVKSRIRYSDQLQIRSFPNPAKEYSALTFNLPSEGLLTIHLKNVLGNDAIKPIVSRETAGEGTTLLPLESLSPGSYQIIVTLFSTEGTFASTSHLAVVH
jgi:hypothetical protein